MDVIYTDAQYGITPACAGKSDHKCCGCGRGRDHPRMRGEKGITAVSVDEDKGSPPHARGKVYIWKIDQTGEGITPACAGKSPVSFRERQHFRDHPRMRGEKCLASSIVIVSKGSPPHARGKVPTKVGGGVCARITPACAGKSEQL